MKQYNGLITNRFSPFMNQKNYERLRKLEIENKEKWYSNLNLEVNQIINYTFKIDEILEDLFTPSNNNNLKELKLPKELLNSEYFIKFNYSKDDYEFTKQVYGLITFPYINFEDLKKIINSWNTEFWNIYIINPQLMKYKQNKTLGLFITPIRQEAIGIINGYFLAETGYKLFYYWTDKEINPIKKDNIELNKTQWFKLINDNQYPIMTNNIVNFWYDNKDKLEYNPLQKSYFEFTHKIPTYFPPIMKSKFISKDNYNIELINTRTKKSLGKCEEIEFDIINFNCIYMDNKILEFDEEMLKDFEEGNYKLKIVKSYM